MPPRPVERRRRPENVLLVIAALAGVCWMFQSAFVQPAKSEAIEAVQDQYLTTKHDGRSGDLCKQAGQVSEAYTRAGDSTGSANWTSVERSDCEAAGYPQR